MTGCGSSGPTGGDGGERDTGVHCDGLYDDAPMTADARAGDAGSGIDAYVPEPIPVIDEEPSP